MGIRNTFYCPKCERRVEGRLQSAQEHFGSVHDQQISAGEAKQIIEDYRSKGGKSKLGPKKLAKKLLPEPSGKHPLKKENQSRSVHTVSGGRVNRR